MINDCKKVELLGLFGFSWKEKVGKEMLTVLNETMYEDTIKDFWGGGSGINTKLIGTLHRVYESYLLKGKTPPTFKGHEPDKNATEMAYIIEEKTKVPFTVTIEFLRSLYTLASTGVMEYKIYDPVGYQEVKEATTDFSIKSFFEQASGKMNLLIITGGIIAGLFLISKVNKSS